MESTGGCLFVLALYGIKIKMSYLQNIKNKWMNTLGCGS